MKYYTRLIYGLLLAMVTAATLAAKLPETFPDSYMYAGTLDVVDMKQRTMVLGDQLYRLADGLRVHRVNGKSGPLSERDVGSVAGVNTSRRGVVREIWMLPRDSLSSLQRRKH